MPETVQVGIPSPVEERVELEPVVPIPSPVFEPVVPAVSNGSAAANGAGLEMAAAADEDASELQRAVVEALNAAKQGSAADAMEDAEWSLVDGEARVQTTLSKTMLPVVMNAAADKVARAALRDKGVLKMALMPGSAAAAAAKKPKAARTGSVQAKALEHPMVQQAQKLFQAEIQTVIDLRKDD
jgi:DNA polymerase-3 subunit gamma/tau